MAQTFGYSHSERGNVLVQDLTDWTGETDGMDQVETEWLDRATRRHITAAVTQFGPEITLGRETQDHLAEEWSENAERAGIDRIAFVSDGIEGRAVSANLDISQEIRTFQSVDKAIEWARE